MDLHWRNSQKAARFFAFDARSAVAVMLFMVHASLWTFSIVVIVMTAFWLFERRGLTFEAALRSSRSWLLGRRRPGTARARRRHWTDFG